MEFKQLVKVFKKNVSNIGIYGLLGALIALILYFWPSKYHTIGSFYVKRGVDTSIEFFTYEGYYAQQTALAYTNTVMALFESVDVQSKTLQNTGKNVNENTLQKISKNTKVKKSGPQLITLTVKGNSPEESKIIWNSLAQETTTAITQINSNGDPKLSISMVADEPVTKKQFKSLSIYLPAGLLLGVALGLLIISLREYDK